jgi:hypothetical protein
LNNIKPEIKEEGFDLISKDFNSENCILPQFRSVSKIKEIDEEKIKTEEVFLSQDSFSKKRESISLIDIRISPLKELINGSKSRKDLKYLFKNNLENSEQKRTKIEDLLRQIQEVNQHTNDILVKFENKNNDIFTSLNEKVIDEVNESVEMSEIKQNSMKDSESSQKKYISNKNDLISSVDTKCNLSLSVRSNINVERITTSNEEKETVDIEISGSKANICEPSLTLNNTDNIFKGLGQYDELVIETPKDNIISIPKIEILKNKLKEIEIVEVNDKHNEIDNEIDLNIIASKKKFLRSICEETAERFKYSPDQFKLEEKDKLHRNIKNLQDQIELLNKEINTERSKHKKEISSFNISMEVFNPLDLRSS